MGKLVRAEASSEDWANMSGVSREIEGEIIMKGCGANSVYL